VAVGRQDESVFKFERRLQNLNIWEKEMKNLAADHI